MRQSGTVLIQTLLFMVVFLGLSSSLLTVSLTESRAVHELIGKRQAFYLAEAGLQEAAWELSRSEDPAGDGIGNVSVQTSSGTYKVTATDLGTGEYILQSQGTSLGLSVGIRSVVRSVPDVVTFPEAAISLLGTVDKSKIFIKKHSGLIIDGGTAPALRISHQDVYDQVLAEFQAAIDDGTFPASNLSGATDGSSSLPIVYDPAYPTGLGDLDAMYQSVVAATDVLIASATQGSISSSGGTFGSAGAPVTLYQNGNLNISSGNTLQGYGTLIVSGDLNIDPGATLDWHGNIIVKSKSTSHSEVDIEGVATVDGNVVVLADSQDTSDYYAAFFEVSDGGNATVNGQIFIANEYNSVHDGTAALMVRNGCTLTVNGLLTMVGRKVKASMENYSNFYLNGMAQFGSPEDPYATMDNLHLKVFFDGNTQIYKDDARILEGIAALKAMGVELDINTDLGVLYTPGTMETLVWQPTYY